MATSLGIHLRADGFSFALLEGNAKKHALKASGEGVFPSTTEPARALGKQIAEAVKLRKADRLTICTPSGKVVLREMSLPFQEREKVLQVLKFEVESELYHLNVEDVVADFIALETERATPTLLVGVVPKKHIAQAIEVCAGAGWDPHAVGASYGGYASALAAIAPRLAAAPAGDATENADATPIVFADLGADETLLAIVGPTGNLRALRTLPIGWLELLRDVAVPKVAQGEVLPPGVDPEAVEEEGGAKPTASPGKLQQKTEAEGDAPADTPQAHFGADPGMPCGIGLAEAIGLAGGTRVTALCKRLANEIRRGLAAMPTGATTLHLTGADLPGLDDAISARAGIPALRLRHGLESYGGRGVNLVALGAALDGIGAAPAPMNFRQEEFRYARGLERVEGPLTLALVGVIAWLVIDAGVHLRTGMEVKKNANEVYLAADKRVGDLNKRVKEDTAYPDSWEIKNDLTGAGVSADERINVLHNRVKSAREDLDELMGQSALEMPSSCLEAWRLLMVFLEKELSDYPDKWMIENFEFTSVDRGRSGSSSVPHVEAKFGLTLKSDDAERIATTFDRIERGLREQPWCVDAPTIPTTETAKVPPGKHATVTVKIRTAREPVNPALEDRP
jgi:hypothetical protein